MTTLTSHRAEVAAGVTRRAIQVILGLVAYAMLLFGAAGRVAWSWGWAYLGVTLAMVAVNTLLIPAELMAERGKKEKANVKPWDRVITSVSTIPYMGMPVVAGLDVRFHGAGLLSFPVHLCGLAVFALSQALFAWAMASNKFFSTAVRIQLDRGHSVETGGPYRFVRHPGYLGTIVGMLASPFALGSLWALAPGVTLAALFIVRTALEDRTLREELRGYEDYARRVRYRLLPGIW